MIWIVGYLVLGFLMAVVVTRLSVTFLTEGEPVDGPTVAGAAWIGICAGIFWPLVAVGLVIARVAVPEMFKPKEKR